MLDHIDLNRYPLEDSTYIKVYKEGHGICRKLDLSLHHSFQSLTTTLAGMFPDENWKKRFVIIFQDKDGDWFVAEDLPWRIFIDSLKCIKIIPRNSLLHFNGSRINCRKKKKKPP